MLSSIFVGSPQSKYAGIAVLISLTIVSIAILFGNRDSLPLSQKIGAVLLLILVSAPGVLFSLFQLTCLVTGAGRNNQRWWCSVYAWIITALLIVYSILLVAVAVLSVSTGSAVIGDLTNYNIEKFEDSMSVANAYAGTLTQSSPSSQSTPSSLSNLANLSSLANQSTPSFQSVLSNQPSTPIKSSSTVTSATGTVGNGNNTDNSAYSFASTMLPVVPINRESFSGSVGDPNNRTSSIVGGHDDPSPFPFANVERYTTGRVSSQTDNNNGRTPILGSRDTPLEYPYDDGRILKH
jgi:NADH:ubiquinone oxidoreductase subunit 6 (subunit J)